MKTKEEIKARSQKYLDNNRKKVRNRVNQYCKYKRDNDLEYNIMVKLRGRTRSAIKYQKGFKYGKARELLGCDFETVKNHLESLFMDGMTWDLVMNGKIHIDHILPCVSFNLLLEEEQRKCFHYTNLQPLWALDNQKKWRHIL